jgi:hypothetical protein
VRRLDILIAPTIASGSDGPTVEEGVEERA